MALELPNIPQLFKHSKGFETGLGKERRGAGEIIVSKDGSGDFDNIQEAINAATSGAVIKILNGTYKHDYLILKNSIQIIGQNWNSIIELTGIESGSGAICPLNLNKKSNIIIRDIRINLKPSDNSGEEIGIDGAENIFFDNVKFDINCNTKTITQIFGAISFESNTCTNFRIKNCNVIITAGTCSYIMGNLKISGGEIRNNDFGNIHFSADDSGGNYLFIGGNKSGEMTGGDGGFCYCNFVGNYLGTGHTILNASGNHTTFVGNITDEAITTSGTDSAAGNVVY